MQPQDVEIGPLLNAIGSLGSTVVLSALAWYLIREWFPRLQTRFSETLDKIVERYHADSDKQRADFSLQLDKQRDCCEREMQYITKVYESQIERLFASANTEPKP